MTPREEQEYRERLLLGAFEHVVQAVSHLQNLQGEVPKQSQKYWELETVRFNLVIILHQMRVNRVIFGVCNEWPDAPDLARERGGDVSEDCAIGHSGGAATRPKQTCPQCGYKFAPRGTC